MCCVLCSVPQHFLSQMKSASNKLCSPLSIQICAVIILDSKGQICILLSGLKIKFFRVQTMHILSLLQLIARLTSCFAGYRSSFFLGGGGVVAENMFVFSLLQQAPCNIGFVHFSFYYWQYWIFYRTGTKMSFFSICFV